MHNHSPGCGCHDPNIRIQDQIDDLTVQVGKISTENLPKVTPEDNGKVLKVVDGVWSVAEVPIEKLPAAEDNTF